MRPKATKPERRTWPDTADTTDAYYAGHSAGMAEAWKHTFYMMLGSAVLAGSIWFWGGTLTGYRWGQIDAAQGTFHFHKYVGPGGSVRWIDDREPEWEFRP